MDNVDSSKATGFDNIPPKLLKSALQDLAKPVTSLGNQSVITGFNIRGPFISDYMHDLPYASNLI